MRLIDADELIHLYFDDENGDPVFDFVPWEFVENAPTIEVEPVKHGRWVIEPDERVMYCSFCGWGVEYYSGLEEEWNFCPRCGADMKEVEE